MCSLLLGNRKHLAGRYDTFILTRRCFAAFDNRLTTAMMLYVRWYIWLAMLVISTPVYTQQWELNGNYPLSDPAGNEYSICPEEVLHFYQGPASVSDILKGNISLLHFTEGSRPDENKPLLV